MTSVLWFQGGACSGNTMSFINAAEPSVVKAKAPEKMASNKIQCDACPVLCQISEGRLGACDRWGNVDGRLARVDPLVLFQKVAAGAGEVTAFAGGRPWDGGVVTDAPVFISGVGFVLWIFRRALLSLSACHPL